MLELRLPVVGPAKSWAGETFDLVGTLPPVGAENSLVPLTCGFARAAFMVRWNSGTARSTRIVLWLGALRLSRSSSGWTEGSN
jgi:hypothetical protein